MDRVLEPELMGSVEQSEVYARADFEEVNQGFVDRFRATFPELRRGRVVDLGCGPADIPARLVRALPGLHVSAVDGSAAMLDEGRRRFLGEPPIRGISLVRARFPALPFRPATFDAVISNSLVHHLADATPLWTEVARLGRSGACVLISDLCRPDCPQRAREIVETYSGHEPEILKQDFYNSLLAAFTVEEIRSQIGPLRPHLDCRMISDRHWLVSGRVP